MSLYVSGGSEAQGVEDTDNSDASMQTAATGDTMFIRRFLAYIRQRPLLSGSIACWLVLTALVWLAFGRTLSSYFLADDFGEVAYAGMITDGNWNLFWSNWTGNYMQIPSMAVYRPWLMVTLVADHLLWGANAFGYYLTNLLYLTGTTLLVFGICKEVASKWKTWRCLLFALMSAGLFAASPLHCESTSWVVGRVDIACCFYYLASFLVFVRAQKPQFVGLRLPLTMVSVGLFLIAMLIKEMAIGLPVLVTAFVFLFPCGFAGVSQDLTLQKRLLSAAKLSAPFWVATVLYFIVRYAALGTLLGGYTGGIGTAQANSAWENWLQIDIYKRVLFPLPFTLYGLNSTFSQALGVCYIAALTLTAVRAISKQTDWPLTAFICIWIVTTLLPIYKLWALGLDLEGSRFLFFLTVPLSTLLPLLLLAPSRLTTSQSTRIGRLSVSPNAALTMLGALVLLVIFGTYLKVATATDSTWIRAGREVKSCQQQAVSIAKSLPRNHRAIVLGIPKNLMAAHMIYNGDTFKTMLRPPFTQADYSKSFLTFDPILFGPSQYINESRLRQALAQSDVEGAFVWNRKSKTFERLALARVDKQRTPPVNLPLNAASSDQTQVYAEGHATVTPSANGLLFQSVSPGDGLRFSELSFDPLTFGALELKARVKSPINKALEFKASWQGRKALDSADAVAVRSITPETANTLQSFSVVIPLSGYWRWYTQGKIEQICLSIPTGTDGIEVLSVKLLPSAAVRPTLVCLNGTDDGTGVLLTTRQGRLAYDASGVPGAAQVQVESTPPNFFFDQSNNSTSGIYVSYKIPEKNGNLGLGEDLVPMGGFTQVRVRALDKNGKALGDFSDPVTLLIHP